MTEQNYYAAPKAELTRGVAEEFEGQGIPASRLQRFLAYLVDYFVFVLAYIPFFILMIVAGDSDVALLMSMLLFFAGILGVAAYNIWLLHENGQTIGKRALGIKIVRGDRMTRASTPRLVLGRYLLIMGIGQIPCLGALFILINYLMIFGEEKRCGHDYIMDTHVVVDDGVVGRTPEQLAAAGIVVGAASGSSVAGHLEEPAPPDPYGGFDDFYGAETDGTLEAESVWAPKEDDDEGPLW